MGQILILLVVALVAAALVFGVVTLLTGGEQGLEPAEPDGRAVPLPVSRPLTEVDLDALRFDTALRGYRMSQVDQALRRAAYDLGYKEELISVLEAEVAALREGRAEDAEALRKARESAARPPVPDDGSAVPAAGTGAAAALADGDAAEPHAAEPEAAESEAVESEAVEPEAGTDVTAEPEAGAGADAAGAEAADASPVEVSVATGAAEDKADAQK